MNQARKKSIIAAALLALLTTVGCELYNDHDRYRYGRHDRSDGYSRLDLDRDGRVERWERDRGPLDRNWRYDRYSDSRYRDRFD